ncbi:MAG: hypothetical protein RR696_02675 [Clostridia bacterium]
MQPFHKRFTVLVGNYGSGKTELAIAIARHMRKQVSGRVALVDLDIVNPYFRSAEQEALLHAENIEVLMPSFAMSTVDIPALPAQIQSVFEQDFAHVVIDVGGDDTGATALGRYAPYIAPLRDQMSVLYVVNPHRPLSGTKEDILEMFSLIGLRARLKPDFLVNNANLQEQTTVDDLLRAQALLNEVSDALHVPIGMIAGEARLGKELPEALQPLFFAFQPLMKPDWLMDEC